MPNDFSGGARYYDVIQGVKDFEKYAKFTAKVLNEFNVKTVLELGCGTGLYLFPLQKAGFDIEGLDVGKEMLALARTKGKAVLHEADMANFNLKKQFDAVLCMNTSLLYLPDWKSMVSALSLVGKHLKPQGIFILDVPDLGVEIKELDKVVQHVTFALPKGKLKVRFTDYVKGNRWFAEWQGEATENGKKMTFSENYSELIYDVKELEKELKKRFKIIRMYGSREGAPFVEGESWRRMYVCQKSAA